jgi:hypothetical protein
MRVRGWPGSLPARTGNVYDLRELAGAFGDLGTFVPFVVGYLTVTRLDPAGVLVAFGLAQVAVGLTYRTPLAVQPMKAIATVAVASPLAITPGAVQVAALFTGLLWLGLALTGAAGWLARVTGRPVVQGLMLGLGLALALEGVRMMAGDVAIALAAALGVLVLGRRAAAAVLALVVFGAAVALVREPALATDLARAGLAWRVPAPHVADVAWGDVVTGVLLLALPQVALTFGNAVLAAVEENNTVFPDRPVTVRAVALDHGLMNLGSAALGGIPMCHGAGGMAGHVRFGARSGGALVILGALTLGAGLVFADGIALALRGFPGGVLGLILLLAGLELASVAPPASADRTERLVVLATAALAIVNVAAGFLAGLVLWHLARRGWLRL